MRWLFIFLLPVVAMAAPMTQQFWNVNIATNTTTRILRFSDGTTMTTAASGSGGIDGTNDTLSGSIFDSGTINSSTISNITGRGTITIGGGFFGGLTMGYNAANASRRIIFIGPSSAPELYANTAGLGIDGNAILTTATGVTNGAFAINGWTVTNGTGNITVSGGLTTTSRLVTVGMAAYWLAGTNGMTANNLGGQDWVFDVQTNSAPVAAARYTTSLLVSNALNSRLWYQDLAIPSDASGWGASNHALQVWVKLPSTSALTNALDLLIWTPTGTSYRTNGITPAAASTWFTATISTQALGAFVAPSGTNRYSVTAITYGWLGGGVELGNVEAVLTKP